MSNRRKLGVCIVGCGTISDTHAGALKLNEDLYLAGVCDRNAAAAGAFAEKNGCRSFASVAEACSDGGVNIVAVCTPSGTHFKIAEEILSYGKHAVVEKPVALKSEQCETLQKLAEEKGVVCTMIAQQRFLDTVGHIKAAVDGGKLGRIVFASLDMRYFRAQDYYDSSPWKGTIEQDGGVLMNQGIHGVDLMCGILGRPKVLQAEVKTLERKIEADDTVTATVEYPCGAQGVITCTVCAYPGYPRRIEINGTKGSVVLEENDIVRWDIDADLPASEAPKTRSYREHVVSDFTLHAKQYRDLASHLLDGTPLEYSLDDAEASIACIEDIYKYRQAR